MPSANRDRGHNWRRVRKQVLERDAYRCRIKIMDCCTTIATTVHHTVGQAITGNNPEFLVAACRECNRRVGSPDNNNHEPRRTTRW